MFDGVLAGAVGRCGLEPAPFEKAAGSGVALCALVEPLVIEGARDCTEAECVAVSAYLLNAASSSCCSREWGSSRESPDEAEFSESVVTTAGRCPFLSFSARCWSSSAWEKRTARGDMSADILPCAGAWLVIRRRN